MHTLLTKPDGKDEGTVKSTQGYNVFERLNDNYPIDKQEWVTWHCAIKRARGNLVHFSELNIAFPPFR